MIQFLLIKTSRNLREYSIVVVYVYLILIFWKPWVSNRGILDFWDTTSLCFTNITRQCRKVCWMLRGISTHFCNIWQPIFCPYKDTIFAHFIMLRVVILKTAIPCISHYQLIKIWICGKWKHTSLFSLLAEAAGTFLITQHLVWYQQKM